MGRRPRTTAGATLEGTEEPTAIEVVEEPATAVQFESRILLWAANAIDERAVSTVDLGIGDVSEARRLATHLRSIAETL